MSEVVSSPDETGIRRSRILAGEVGIRIRYEQRSATRLSSTAGGRQHTGTLGGLDVCEDAAVAFGFRPVYGALIARYIDTLGLSALFYISGGGESERRNGSQEEGREEPHGEDAGVLYSVVASALIYVGATYKHAYASHGGKD